MRNFQNIVTYKKYFFRFLSSEKWKLSWDKFETKAKI